MSALTALDICNKLTCCANFTLSDGDLGKILCGMKGQSALEINLP